MPNEWIIAGAAVIAVVFGLMPVVWARLAPVRSASVRSGVKSPGPTQPRRPKDDDYVNLGSE